MAGSALLTQASPTWRPHSRIQCVFELDLDPSLFFINQVQPGLKSYSFKVLQGPSQRFRRKSSFSIRVVKHWNTLPITIVTAPSINSFKRCLISAWGVVSRSFVFGHLSPPPSPITLSNFTLSPPLIHCHTKLH